MFTKLTNMINDMRPRQLIALAAVCGVLMFGLFYMTLKLSTGEETPLPLPGKEAPVEMVKVVVAKQNIPVRTRIQESMLQVKELPATAVPEGAIKDMSAILNEPARVSIFAGDVLTQQKLFGERSDEGFLGTIPPDCRAVSISVNNITGVAGFAKPGDYVDLLLVENDNYSATTNLLLQNVPLLSINQSMSATTADGSEAINNPTIATFALRPADALKLVSAAKLGDIYLMLRPNKPQNMYVGEMEYSIESVNKPAPKPEPQPVQQPVPQIPNQPLPSVPLPPAEPKIDIIVGDEIAQKSEDVQVITPQPTPQPPTNANTASSRAPANLPIIPSMPIVDLPPIPNGSN